MGKQEIARDEAMKNYAIAMRVAVQARDELIAKAISAFDVLIERDPGEFVRAMLRADHAYERVIERAAERFNEAVLDEVRRG
jgi:hypothetical protein